MGNLICPPGQSDSADLPARFAENPLEFFTGSSKDFKLARACLESVIRKIHAEHESKESAASVYKDRKVGTRALYWFLNAAESVRYRELYIERANFLRGTMLCATAEGNFDSVYDAFQLGGPSLLSTRSKNSDIQNLDLSTMLHCLLEAQAYWTTHADPLRQPVATFDHALTIGRSTYMPLSAAGKFFTYSVDTTAGLSISAGTFQKVYNAVHTFTPKNGVDPTFLRSLLMLSKPDTPDASDALMFLRRSEEPGPEREYIAQLINRTHSASQAHLFWYIIRAAQLLDDHGRSDDSRWMLSCGRRNVPSFFNRDLSSLKLSSYRRPRLRSFEGGNLEISNMS
ncbi:hypothetical protein EJ03DRAFT_347396 [Teratosphaeria nubilosa]|uniref:Uncharacterized protein n=1 Tax=Teratosphaeria nubilosa TaxID=161662 RepID=A0A6G1LPC4_9PEZI|nr:hypothetical protein EJ03DRAFT_347396 [Teratosphaeria nubilosa]